MLYNHKLPYFSSETFLAYLVHLFTFAAQKQEKFK